MTIQKVTSYKASDGTLFDNYSDAHDHDADIAFKKWYQKDVLRNPEEGIAIYNNAVIAWLRRNKNRIIDFLGERDPEEKQDEQ